MLKLSNPDGDGGALDPSGSELDGGVTGWHAVYRRGRVRRGGQDPAHGRDPGGPDSGDPGARGRAAERRQSRRLRDGDGGPERSGRRRGEAARAETTARHRQRRQGDLIRRADVFRHSDNPEAMAAMALGMLEGFRGVMQMRGLSILPLYLPAKTTPAGFEEAASGSSGASRST